MLAVTDPFDEIVNGQVVRRRRRRDRAHAVRRPGDGRARRDEDGARGRRGRAARRSCPRVRRSRSAATCSRSSVPGVTLTEAVGLIIALLVLIVTFRSFVVAGLPLLTAIIGVGAVDRADLPLDGVRQHLLDHSPARAHARARGRHRLRAVHRRATSGPGARGHGSRGVDGAGHRHGGLRRRVRRASPCSSRSSGSRFAGIPFLTTMGIAAAVAVAIAVLVALTLTPAMLGFVKGRVVGRPRDASRAAHPRSDRDGPRLPRAGPAVPARRTSAGFDAVGRLSRGIRSSRPSPSCSPSGSWRSPPRASRSRCRTPACCPRRTRRAQSYDLVAEEFGPGFNGPLILTGTIVTSTDPLGLMEDLADEIERLPGVEEVALATPNETADTGIVQIIPETAPDDPATAELVRELRVAARPHGSTSTASTSRSPGSPPSPSTSPTSSARR